MKSREEEEEDDEGDDGGGHGEGRRRGLPTRASGDATSSRSSSMTATSSVAVACSDVSGGTLRYSEYHSIARGGHGVTRGLFTKPVNREHTFIADDWHTRGQARRVGSVKKFTIRAVARVAGRPFPPPLPPLPCR